MSRQYLEALRVRLNGKLSKEFLVNGKLSKEIQVNGELRPDVRPANGLGLDATELGLGTLDLARIHEQAMSALIPLNCSARELSEIRRQSSRFFFEALTPIEHSNRRLRKEIIQRKAAEAALLESERHHRALLKQSRAMEHQLRLLSYQVLTAQEEERKKISHELHDQIAQMLAGINVHLATLKGASSLSTIGLNRKIRDSQRMVERSVNMVHHYARELRPPVLDDLGLIPALQSLLKEFTARTSILAHLTVSAGIEALPGNKRTVIFRVVQAALTNVGQHAGASRVKLSIMNVPGAVELHLHDNGKAFDAEKLFLSRKNKRLGLLGMRERVEMVGGDFSIKSAPGEGTTISIQIPFVAGKKFPSP